MRFSNEVETVVLQLGPTTGAMVNAFSTHWDASTRSVIASTAAIGAWFGRSARTASTCISEVVAAGLLRVEERRDRRGRRLASRYIWLGVDPEKAAREKERQRAAFRAKAYERALYRLQRERRRAAREERDQLSLWARVWKLSVETGRDAGEVLAAIGADCVARLQHANCGEALQEPRFRGDANDGTKGCRAHIPPG